MKIYFLSIGILFLSFSSFSQTSVDKTNYSLLWEISGNGLEKNSYLFGSMHVRDKEAFEFSDSLFHKLASCEAFANELHFDSLMIQILEKYANKQNTSKELLNNGKKPNSPASRPTKIKENKVGMPTFLDAYLFDMAKKLGKQVYGLERLEEQVNKLKKVQEETASNDIFSFLFQPLSIDLLSIYQQGDIDVIHQKYPYGQTEAERKRNYVMVNSMERIMKTQSLFAVVGVAHLPGEKGLIELLKKRGYSLRKVTATFTGLADDFEYEAKKQTWVSTKTKDNSLIVETPLPIVKMETDSTPLDVYVSADIGTGSYYYAMKVNFGFSQLTDSEMLKNLEEVWENKNNLKVISSNEIVHKGLKGREYKAISTNRALPFFKIRAFIHKGSIYIFQVAGMENSTLKSSVVNRFFNAVSILKKEGWKELVKPVEAFRINFPIDFTYKKQLTPDPEDTGMIYTIHLYAASDSETGLTQLVRYNDYPDGMYMEDDSIFFEGVSSNFSERLGVTAVKEFDFEKDGYPARSYFFKKARDFVKIQAFLRGNRTYLLMQTGVGVPNNAFFDSFDFLPFQNITLEKMTDETNSLSFYMPPNPVFVDNLVDSYFYRDDYSQYNTYAVSDSITGSAFVVEHVQYGPYTYYENIDSLFNELTSDFVDLEFIEENNFLYQDKYPTRDYYLKEKRANTHFKYRIILAGDQIIFAYVLFPKEIKDETQLDTYFNSFKFLQPIQKDNDFLFQSKKELIFQNLISSDSTTFQNAKTALRETTFEQEELPLIFQKLSDNYQDDTLQYSSVKSILLRKLETIDSPENLPFLKGFFAKNQLPHLNGVILASIIDQNTPEAFQTFFQLVHELPDSIELISQWGILRPFSDSLALFKTHYADFTKLVEKGFFRNRYFDISTRVLLDSTMENNFILENILFYIAQVDTMLNTDSLDVYPNNFYDIISFYEEVPQEEKILQQLQQIGTFSSGWQQLRIISLFLEKKHSIEQTWIDSLLINPYYSYLTIEKLKEYKQLEKVPKAYLEPQALAINMLKNRVTYDEDIPEVKFFKTYETIYQGKECTVYAFWFWFASETDIPTKYLGIAGPFYNMGKKRKAFDFSDELTNTSYEEVTLFEINQRIRDMITERVNELKEEE